MDKSSTPPRNRYTRSAAKKINTPTSKTNKDENEDQNKEDARLSARKSKRKTETKPKTNGDSTADIDINKIKSTCDVSDGNSYDGSESSMASDRRSSSPKALNLKTPPPSISRKSLRLRRSITPGPEAESNTPKRIRRSSSMSQLEPKSAQRNRRAQSVNKDFTYSPSKVNPEIASSKSKSCFKLDSVDKIDEGDEDSSSQDDISLLNYIKKSNTSQILEKNASPADNISPSINCKTAENNTSKSDQTCPLTTSKTAVNITTTADNTPQATNSNDERESTYKPNIASTYVEENVVSQNLNVLPKTIENSSDVETGLLVNDETDSTGKSNNATDNPAGTELCQNITVLSIIEEDPSENIADEQNNQVISQNNIVTIKTNISKSYKSELSPNHNLLSVIKEEDSDEEKVKPSITFKAINKEKGLGEGSDIETTSENIVQEPLCEGHFDNNFEESSDNQNAVPDNSIVLEVEEISDEDSVNGNSKSRSESQNSTIDSSSECDEINTENSNRSVNVKIVSPEIRSIPVTVTRIYENNNDTFIQPFHSEVLESNIISQRNDLKNQNEIDSGLVLENSESHLNSLQSHSTEDCLDSGLVLENSESHLNSLQSHSTEDCLTPKENVSEPLLDENNDVVDCEKLRNVKCASGEQMSVNEEINDETQENITEEDNSNKYEIINKPVSQQYDQDDEAFEVVIGDINGHSIDVKEHQELKSNSDYPDNGHNSNPLETKDENINEMECQIVHYSLPVDSETVPKDPFEDQQITVPTSEDNSSFHHKKTANKSDQLDLKTDLPVDDDFKSSNAVEIINDTPSECSESNSDIYKDMSDYGGSEPVGSPNSDKYVSDDNEEEDDDDEEEDELDDEGEEVEEEEDELDEDEEECEQIKEENKVTQENIAHKNESQTTVKKEESATSVENADLHKNENMFDTEQPITYDKALEMLNKDRDKKINDDEFFEMFTEELRRVSGGEEGSDSDIAIVDEWIPENLPKPVIKGIKRPPQRPPTAMLPRHTMTANQRFTQPVLNRLQAPQRFQGPQHQIQFNNQPQVQEMNYLQGGMYNQYNTDMRHIDNTREHIFYNQFGAPNHNIPDPRYCDSGNAMENFAHAGMFSHPLEHVSEPSMQYHAQEMQVTNPDFMRHNSLSGHQSYPAESGKVSSSEFPKIISAGPQIFGNNQHSTVSMANSGISTPKNQMIKPKSHTSASEDGDKVHTPVLNLLKMKSGEIIHLKKVLGLTDKSSDEKMGDSPPYAKTKPKSTRKRTKDKESKTLASKKEMTEYVKRYLEGDRSMPAWRKTSISQQLNNDRQVDIEDGNVTVTVNSQKLKRERRKLNRRLKLSKLILESRNSSENSRWKKLKRQRRKRNKRLKLANNTSESSSFENSSSSFESFLTAHKKQKLSKTTESSSSSSTSNEATVPSKRFKTFNERFTTIKKMVQGKKQKKEPTVLKSKAGMFTVDSVTSSEHEITDFEATSGSSSEYAQEFRKQVEMELASRKNKISNIFSQQSKEHKNVKKNKGEGSTTRGSSRKRVLRKLPDDVLEELSAGGKPSKKRVLLTTDSEVPRKRRKKSSKIRVKSAAAEEEYIPYVTSGATQFALSRLDKEGVLGLAQNASTFRNNQLYGSPVKRITSKELINIKKKQELNGSKKLVKKK